MIDMDRIKITSDLSLKKCVHRTEIFPEIAKNALIGLTKLKIFWGSMTSNSPRKFAASPQTRLLRLQQSPVNSKKTGTIPRNVWPYNRVKPTWGQPRGSKTRVGKYCTELLFFMDS